MQLQSPGNMYPGYLSLLGPYAWSPARATCSEAEQSYVDTKTKFGKGPAWTGDVFAFQDTKSPNVGRHAQDIGVQIVL